MKTMKTLLSKTILRGLWRCLPLLALLQSAQAFPPTIQFLAPPSALAGSGGFTLTVVGFGFDCDGGNVEVLWNGVPLAGPTSCDLSNAVVSVPASKVVISAPNVNIETAIVTVRNSTSPGDESNPLAFTIYDASVTDPNLIDSEVVLAGESTIAQTAYISPGDGGVVAHFANAGGAPATVTVANLDPNTAAGTIFDTGGGVFDLRVVGADSSDSLTANFYYSSSVSSSAENDPGFKLNKMVPATVNGRGCSIVSVSSNEPQTGPGPDWQITGPLTVNLRAARLGSGGGRIYTIHVQCSDGSENVAVVRVPHDQRND
jgi:hypothetical protein